MVAVSFSWFFEQDASASSDAQVIDFTVPSGTISMRFECGNCWQDWLATCPDVKEIINNLHVTIYRKARFVKKLLKLPSEHRRPITNRMMLQRTNFRGRMARI